MAYKLSVLNIQTDTKHFIGLFDSMEMINMYLKEIYSIVTLNESQHLLIMNDISKDGKEIVSRQLISVAESVAELQKFLNEAHVIESTKSVKDVVHDKIVELQNEITEDAIKSQ